MKKRLSALLAGLLLLSVISCAAPDPSGADGVTGSGTGTEDGGTETEGETAPLRFETEPDTLYHILLLGQSLSMGCSSGPCLPPCSVGNAFMFGSVRTQDLGYFFGIGREEYNEAPEKYEEEFYRALLPLRETGGDGFPSEKWEQASGAEYETPCTGVAEGLAAAFRRDGEKELPFSLLLSAPGVGGTSVYDFCEGGRILSRAKKDMENGRRLAEAAGLRYRVLAFLWMQGETESEKPVAMNGYDRLLISIRESCDRMAKQVTGQEESPFFVTYQSMQITAAFSYGNQKGAILPQFLAAADPGAGIAMSAPCYQFASANDRIHMTNVSSRNLGMMLGYTLYDLMQGEYRLFRPETEVKGSTAVLTFPFAVCLDEEGPRSSYDPDQAGKSAGFFCYDRDHRLIDCTVSLSEDARAVILRAEEPFDGIAYGYSPEEKDNAQYTLGGHVCTARTYEVYDGITRLYMPVQDIYRSPSGD